MWPLISGSWIQDPHWTKRWLKENIEKKKTKNPSPVPQSHQPHCEFLIATFVASGFCCVWHRRTCLTWEPVSAIKVSSVRVLVCLTSCQRERRKWELYKCSLSFVSQIHILPSEVPNSEVQCLCTQSKCHVHKNVSIVWEIAGSMFHNLFCTKLVQFFKLF